ncbi:MAG: thioredoxin family protein [Lentisphaerae bacterium]|nr:thioredoxin family protein [Lentisphaerota bacterium]
MNTKTAVSAALPIILAGALGVNGADWGTDFEAAKRQAAEKQRPILVNFTGSDWCGWCMKLDEEVFSADAFREYAREHLVLFEADFPSDLPQPEAVIKQNRSLMETYKVRGFPTIVLLNAEGKELARTGYRPGGAGAYVKHLKDLIESIDAAAADPSAGADAEKEG